MRRTLTGALAMALLVAVPAGVQAVTPAEDIAATIMLRGFPCDGKQVTGIEEKDDASGARTIRATCPNGRRYQIDVSPQGKVTVKPL